MNKFETYLKKTYPRHRKCPAEVLTDIRRMIEIAETDEWWDGPLWLEWWPLRMKYVDREKYIAEYP